MALILFGACLWNLSFPVLRESAKGQRTHGCRLGTTIIAACTEKYHTDIRTKCTVDNYQFFLTLLFIYF